MVSDGFEKALLGLNDKRKKTDMSALHGGASKVNYVWDNTA